MRQLAFTFHVIALVTILLSFAQPSLAQAPKSDPAGASSSIDGSKEVTLKDGSKVSLDTLWRRARNGESDVADTIASRSTRVAYYEYVLRAEKTEGARLDAEIARKEAVIVQKGEEWIQVLAKLKKRDGDVGSSQKAAIRRAVDDPNIPDHIKDGLRKFLQ